MSFNRRRDSKCSVACKRCRVRKIRCDQSTPCKNCRNAHLECEKNETSEDGRKKRYKNLYVRSLEYQVKTLQTILSQLIEPTNTPQDHDCERSPIDLDSSANEVDTDASPNTGNGLLYGDIFYSVKEPSCVDNQKLRVLFRNLNSNGVIMKCIDNFLRWQYFDAQYCLDKISFLDELLLQKEDVGRCCSEELVYSIAALGAKLDADPKVQERAFEFYMRAKMLIFSEKALQPSATTVQSLLCLSMYDNGYNDSSCWMLSGVAFRMGFHLGFDKFLQSEKEYEIDNHLNDPQHRFFWGCFVYDHYTSLLLGRSVTLTIPKKFRILHLNKKLKIHASEDCGSLTTEYTLMKMIELSILLESFLEDMNQFSISSDKKTSVLNISLKTSKLNDINAKLIKWKSEIDSEIGWNKEELQTSGHDISKMSFKGYFYLILLCFNKPFASIKFNKNLPPAVLESLRNSMEVVEDCIDDIYISLKSYHEKMKSFKYISLTMIYAIILSLNYYLSAKASFPDSLYNRTIFEYFLSVLKGISEHWKLAVRANDVIVTRIRNKWPVYYNEIFKVQVQVPILRLLTSELSNLSLMEDFNLVAPSTADTIMDIDDLFRPNIDFKSLDNLDSNLSSWSHIFPELYR